MVCPIKNGARLRNCARYRLAMRRYMPIIPNLCGHVQHTFGESSHTFYVIQDTDTRARPSRLELRGLQARPRYHLPTGHAWVRFKRTLLGASKGTPIVASPACRTPRSTRNTKQPGVRGSGRGCGGYGDQGHAVGEGFADEGTKRGVAERARRLARRHIATCFSRRYRKWQAKTMRMPVDEARPAQSVYSLIAFSISSTTFLSTFSVSCCSFPSASCKCSMIGRVATCESLRRDAAIMSARTA
mmetsp:Transcript_34169/g.72939  ORF Transcript_34169/g.72939 Transcript_34169/m.72939 type:complete len:243 (-) Transcript_34169:1872-2600(-)